MQSRQTATAISLWYSTTFHCIGMLGMLWTIILRPGINTYWILNVCAVVSCIIWFLYLMISNDSFTAWHAFPMSVLLSLPPAGATSVRLMIGCRHSVFNNWHICCCFKEESLKIGNTLHFNVTVTCTEFILMAQCCFAGHHQAIAWLWEFTYTGYKPGCI